MPTRPSSLPPPNGPLGIIVIVTALAAAGTLLAASMRDDDPLSVAGLALVGAMPVGILAAYGHFGRDRWELPTPGAFIFLFWLLGIGPALLAWTDYFASFLQFSPEAVPWARIVTFVWFLLFALAMGPAPQRSEPAEDHVGQWVTFVTGLALWAIATSIAARNGGLSQYRATMAVNAVGGSDSAWEGIYNGMTPLVLPLGVAAAAQARPLLRALGVFAIAAGTAGLFVRSERREAVISVYLCLCMLRAYRVRLSWRSTVPVIAIAWLLTGPVVTLYRRYQLEDAATTDNPVQQALAATLDFAGNAKARARASEESARNLRDRLGVSTLLFAMTDVAMHQGAHGSPSFLEPLVRMVPTVLWPEKNDVAAGLNAETQFRSLDGVPDMDCGPSPIAEFVFEFGLWAGVLGGIAYGLVCRLINATSARSASAGPWGFAWLAAVISFAHFDGGTSILGALREPIAIAICAGLIASLARPPMVVRTVRV
jgi:hypothetical protein